MASADEDAAALDALWEEVERASGIDDADARRRALEAVAGALESLAVRSPSAGALYTLGYAWYFHPDRLSSSAVKERVVKALRAALALDPHHAKAWMYLGHHDFDLGRYESARASFARVDLDQLGDYWRLKALEMQACCAIALDGLSRSLPAIEEFVQSAEPLPSQDIWPSELARWIKSQAGTLGEPEKGRLSGLAERLDRAGQFGDWFSSLVPPPVGGARG